MTEEEIKELSEIDQKRIIFSARHLTWHLDGEVIDYLNKKMFDWRGLIHQPSISRTKGNVWNIEVFVLDFFDYVPRVYAYNENLNMSF